MRESLWDTSMQVDRGAARTVPLHVRRAERAALGSRVHACAADDAGAATLRELEARRAWWSEALTRRARLPGRVRWARVWGAAIIIVLLFTGGMLMIFGLPLAALVLWLELHAARERSRLKEALIGSRCPDCRYQVAHTPAAGPDACSECGSPWPLVPPEIPRDVVLTDKATGMKAG